MTDEDRIAEELEKPASTTRLEAFSDGVFAIIITLLLLDLHVPRAGGDLSGALRAMWPNYVAFVVSFCLVGVIWANHHTMFRWIHHADHMLIVLNTLLLLSVAVLLFTAALLAEYTEGTRAEQRLAALVYAGALVIGGVFYNLVWWYAVRAGLCASAEAAAALRRVGRYWLSGPVLYAVAFGLAWVSPPLSVAMYIALILYFAVSGSWVARRIAHPARRAQSAVRRA